MSDLYTMQNYINLYNERSGQQFPQDIFKFLKDDLPGIKLPEGKCKCGGLVFYTDVVANILVCDGCKQTLNLDDLQEIY